MRKTVFALLALLLVFSLVFAGCGKATDPTDPDDSGNPGTGVADPTDPNEPALEVPTNFPMGMGNSLNNLANSGLAVESSGWIYYIVSSMYMAIPENGIYKMRLDCSEKTRLFSNPCSSLNIADDWLYFGSFHDGSHIMRMKTDGTQCTSICSGRQPTYLDGWIYFLSDDDGFCKIRPDGTENIYICDTVSLNYLIVDGWVYGSSNNEINNEIYKVKVDGTSKTTLCIIDNYNNFVIDGDWVYYTQVRDISRANEYDYQIYKIRLDGSGNALIVDNLVESPNEIGIFDGKLYYYSSINWYRANLDGTGAEKLDSRFHGIDINFAGGWMITQKLYMLRVDGSNFYYEEILEEG